MKWAELKAGIRLELVPLPNGREHAPYISQLLAPVVQSAAILVAMPVHGCQYAVWPAGTLLQVSFVEPGRGIWRFMTRIEAAGTVGTSLDRIRTYTLRAESEPERCQRRAHFRVDCLLEATLRQGSPETTIRAVTRNISGGGACVLVDGLGDKLANELAAGPGQIDLVFPADGRTRQISARCEVVRCESASANGQVKHRICLKFIQVTPKDQDALVRCLLKLQLKQGRQAE